MSDCPKKKEKQGQGKPVPPPRPSGHQSLVTKLDEPSIDGAFAIAHISSKPVMCYVDSGASASFMTPDTAALLQLEVRQDQEAPSLYLLDKSRLNISGHLHCDISMCNDVIQDCDFLVADIATPVLLGRDFLEKSGLAIDLGAKTSCRQRQSSDFKD